MFSAQLVPVGANFLEECVFMNSKKGLSRIMSALLAASSMIGGASACEEKVVKKTNGVGVLLDSKKNRGFDKRKKELGPPSTKSGVVNWIKSHPKTSAGVGILGVGGLGAGGYGIYKFARHKQLPSGSGSSLDKDEILSNALSDFAPFFKKNNDEGINQAIFDRLEDGIDCVKKNGDIYLRVGVAVNDKGKLSWECSLDVPMGVNSEQHLCNFCLAWFLSCFINTIYAYVDDENFGGSFESIDELLGKAFAGNSERLDKCKEIYNEITTVHYKTILEKFQGYMAKNKGVCLSLDGGMLVGATVFGKDGLVYYNFGIVSTSDEARGKLGEEMLKSLGYHE